MKRYAEFVEGAAKLPPLTFCVRAAVEGDALDIAMLWATAHDNDVAMAGVADQVAGEIGMATAGHGRVVMVAEGDAGLLAYGRARLWTSDEVLGQGMRPSGWWLSGSLVAEHARRRGVGAALMQARLAFLNTTVHSKVNVSNRVSLHWHASAGFVEVARDFTTPSGAKQDEPYVLLRWLSAV